MPETEAPDAGVASNGTLTSIRRHTRRPAHLVVESTDNVVVVGELGRVGVGEFKFLEAPVVGGDDEVFVCDFEVAADAAELRRRRKRLDTLERAQVPHLTSSSTTTSTTS